MPPKPLIILAFANDATTGGNPYLDQLNRERENLELIRDKDFYDVKVIAPATSQKLWAAITDNQNRLVAFHFAGHADEGEIMILKGGVDSASLASLLSTCPNLKLVFLNGCHTATQKDLLHQAGVPAVMGTSYKVEDHLATDFAIQVYQQLAHGNTDLDTAFTNAKNYFGNASNAERVKGITRDRKGSSVPTPAVIDNWGLFLKEGAPEKIYLRLPHQNPIPKELTFIPRPPISFTGRTKELTALKDKLESGSQVLLLNGLGGIGKTTLAQQYVQTNRDTYSHIAWITSAQDPDEHTSQTLRADIAYQPELTKRLGLNLSPDTPEEVRFPAIMEALAKLGTPKQPALLVLDNASSSAEDIYQQLPSGPNWQILLTSREQMNVFSLYQLDQLSPQEAEALFLALYPRGKQEVEDVRELLAYIGYHTLTLEMMARACNSIGMNPQKLLSRLKEGKFSHLSKQVWSGHSESKQRIYEYLLTLFDIEGLSEPAKHILRQWALLPSINIPEGLLISLFSKGELSEEDGDAMDLLVQKGWIQLEAEKGSFRCHQMIQEVMRHKLEPDQDNCQALIQRISTLLNFDQDRDNPADRFSFIIFGETLLAKLLNKDSLAAGKEINKLRYYLARLYNVRAMYKEAIELLQKALAATLQEEGEESAFLANIRNELARVYDNLGRYEEAIGLYELALKSYIPTFGEENPNIALTRSNLAIVYRKKGRYEDAIELYELALNSDIQNFGEEHPNVARVRSNLAGVYTDLGRNEEAIELLQIALNSDIQNFGEEHPNVANKRSNLAIEYRKQGQYDEAIELYRLALISDIKNFGKEHPNVAKVRSNLAVVYNNQGRYEEAIELHELALSSDINNFGEEHPKVAFRMGNLGVALYHLDQYTQAKPFLEKSYHIFFKVFGKDHPHTQTALSWLEDVNQQLS